MTWRDGAPPLRAKQSSGAGGWIASSYAPRGDAAGSREFAQALTGASSGNQFGCICGRLHKHRRKDLGRGREFDGLFFLDGRADVQLGLDPLPEAYEIMAIPGEYWRSSAVLLSSDHGARDNHDR
jgi:hypothetical protein